MDCCEIEHHCYRVARAVRRLTLDVSIRKVRMEERLSMGRADAGSDVFYTLVDAERQCIKVRDVTQRQAKREREREAAFSHRNGPSRRRCNAVRYLRRSSALRVIECFCRRPLHCVAVIPPLEMRKCGKFRTPNLTGQHTDTAHAVNLRCFFHFTARSIRDLPYGSSAF